MSVTMAKPRSAGGGPARDMRVAAALSRRRGRRNWVAKALCALATVTGLAFRALILLSLLWLGASGLSAHVFTTPTRPPGSHGGLANAIVGSLIQTALGTAIGTPVGLLVGTFLAEYARGSALGSAVRFVSDVLLSAPSN